MKYLSTAIITKEKKWFVARSLELGVVSQGRTVEEAKQNLKEAVELYLEGKPEAKKSLAPAHTIVTAIEVGRG
ncbi:MAG: type II toxin-antitoxin system HicB family antitoxin [bacterium]|nr:type II toxin-antitoxin system HicB family antitoxin [bacterium]